MNDFRHHDIMEALQAWFDTDDGTWLLEAIRRCGQYDMPMPPMLREEFNKTIERYTEGQADTLGGAFKVHRKKGWNQSAAISRARKDVQQISKAGRVWLEVVKRHQANIPIDAEMFEEIGSQFSISASTARNYYREVKKINGYP